MTPVVAAVAREPHAALVTSLRALAVEGLERMYDRGRGLFVFRVRRTPDGIVREGHSELYTAIGLIGLAGEPRRVAARVLGGESIVDVAQRLVEAAATSDRLGVVALAAWAGHVCGCATDRLWTRVLALGPDSRPHATVPLAWTLSALCADDSARAGTLSERLAARLCRAFSSGAALFPHQIGASTGWRPGHVACFADFVYPTLALAQYGAKTGDAAAIECASSAARAMCARQGAAGQWWWHFDYRTGRVIEGYPVYAVHQDSMAPMALFAAADVAGEPFDTAIARGLRWLAASPELGGASLVDGRAGLIWRKVARREPARLSRYVQATVSQLSPRLHAPGLDALFPPTAIDYEDRPYHLGWVLYAWPAARAAAWSAGAHA